MSAAKGNKYNQHGDEPMDAFIHCRITTKEKQDFIAKCKELGTDMTKELLKFIRFFNSHRPKK